MVGPLGRGGSGEVTLVQDVEGILYARKVVPLPPVDDRGRERILAEGVVLARLAHPHIVGVHEAFEEDNSLHLVLDYVEAGSLADRLKSGPIPEPEAVRLIAEVLSALAYCHAHGVVHRDVKPGNVLIGADGGARLADFGIAKATGGELTRTGEALGTWAFMAPEQRLDSRRVDARADVYGAGATLFAVLTGEPPFDLANPALSDDRVSRLSPHMALVVRRATRALPEGRWASAEEMRAVLLGPPGGVLAEEPSFPAGLPRQDVLRRGWLYPAAVLAALTLGAVIALPLATSPTATAIPSSSVISPAAELPLDPTAPPPDAVPAPPPVPAPVAATPTRQRPADPEPAQTSTARQPAEPPAPPDNVNVAVNSVPWSEIEIDGLPLGRTPWRGSLTAGSHLIALTSADGRSARPGLTARAGSTLCWDFDRQGECAK